MRSPGVKAFQTPAFEMAGRLSVNASEMSVPTIFGGAITTIMNNTILAVFLLLTDDVNHPDFGASSELFHRWAESFLVGLRPRADSNDSETLMK